MRRGRKHRTDADPTTLTYELALPERQQRFRSWCSSIDEHRFDCDEAPREQRGAGPFLPVSAPTPAEIVAALRRST